jgi:integrase
MLLMYENAFRPHQEIRNIRKKDLKENNTILSIGTKNRSISTRKLSEEVKRCLNEMNLNHLPDQANIFSAHVLPPSKEYFINKWKTYRRRLSKMGMELPEDLTLYSIRHTMACDLYRKTNSIDAVRRFMGHRSLQTTEGYLRKIGAYHGNEINNLSL